MGAFSLDKYETLKPLFVEKFDISDTVKTLNAATKDLEASTAAVKPAPGLEGVDMLANQELVKSYQDAINQAVDSTLNPMDQSKLARNIAIKYTQDPSLEIRAKSVEQRDAHDKVLDSRVNKGDIDVLDAKLSRHSSLVGLNRSGGSQNNSDGTFNTYEKNKVDPPPIFNSFDLSTKIKSAPSGTLTETISYRTLPNGQIETTSTKRGTEYWSNGQEVAKLIWESDEFQARHQWEADKILAKELVKNGEYATIEDAFDEVRSNPDKYAKQTFSIRAEEKLRFMEMSSGQHDFKKVNNLDKTDLSGTPDNSGGGSDKYVLTSAFNTLESSRAMGGQAKAKYKEYADSLAKDGSLSLGGKKINFQDYLNSIKAGKEKEFIESTGLQGIEKASLKHIFEQEKYKKDIKDKTLKQYGGVDNVLIEKLGYDEKAVKSMSAAQKETIFDDLAKIEEVPTSDIILPNRADSDNAVASAFTSAKHIKIVSNGVPIELTKEQFKQGLVDNTGSDQGEFQDLFDEIRSSGLLNGSDGSAPDNDDQAFNNYVNNIKKSNTINILTSNPDTKGILNQQSTALFGVQLPNSSKGTQILFNPTNEIRDSSNKFTDLVLAEQSALHATKGKAVKTKIGDRSFNVYEVNIPSARVFGNPNPQNMTFRYYQKDGKLQKEFKYAGEDVWTKTELSATQIMAMDAGGNYDRFGEEEKAKGIATVK